MRLRRFVMLAALCLLAVSCPAYAAWNSGGVDISIPDELYQVQQKRLFRQDGSVALPSDEEDRCLLAAELFASVLMQQHNGEPAPYVQPFRQALYAEQADESLIYLFEWIPGHGFEAGLLSQECVYSISYDLNQVFGFEGIDPAHDDMFSDEAVLTEGQRLNDGTVIPCYQLDRETVIGLIERLVP